MSSVPIEHAPAFRRRRFINWLPMGRAYAFLYMGRYNLTVSKNALGNLMTKEDFGIIFGWGTVVYAFAFLINGPLVDKIGGRKGILIATFGSAVMNLAMGVYLSHIVGSGDGGTESMRLVFTLLYCGNMYFQSYGAVAIVKVNAHWFHVRERGGFSGIFGTMIASGIFLAFTVNGWILNAFTATGMSEAVAAKYVFFAPTVLLFAIFIIEALILRDSPSKAGFEDFDTHDASSGEEGVDIPLFTIMKRIITNPIILTVALIEFCTGVIRNGVMHWFPIYAKESWVLPGSHYLRYGSWGAWWVVAILFVVAALFVYCGTRARGARKAWLIVSGALIFLVPFLQGGWGGILFVAGVIGANVAGWVSDLFFNSRRAPVAGILYATLTVASIGMFFTLGGTSNRVDWAKAPEDFENNDVIVALGETPVSSWAEVDACLGQLPRSTDAGRNIQVAVDRAGKIITVDVACHEGADGLPVWGILPVNGMRLVDAGAPPAILSLQRGDSIEGLAQTPEKLIFQLAEGAFSTWDEVSSAVGAVPARAEGRAAWDPEKQMCTYDGTGIPDGEAPSNGLLHARIVRDGRTLDVALRDPAPTMRAGDQRKLAAGPVLRLSPLWLGLIIFIMSIGVIGTHGLLSGTATMDFGGRKGAATAVGMIDGFVYLGTGIQSFSLGYLTTLNWMLWPVFLFPFGVFGFLLLRRIWHAIPSGKKKAAH